MNIKERISTELEKPDFPNLDFLYSPQVLQISEEVLDELLEKERQEFQQKLETPDTDITFELFDDFSELSYFFGILEHYQWVNNDDEIRGIIERFEPKYIDFWNEIAYSKRYYDMVKYCLENTQLDSEQKRILEMTLEEYEVRWIDLPKQEQDTLKQINKRISELSQKFGNQLLDSQKQFSYSITDEQKIIEMPEDDKQVARKKAQEKSQDWYLFDASGNAYISIMKYCWDPEVRKYFYEARLSFATEQERDNNQVIIDILKQRQTKATILWFGNYAELSLHFKMAETPQQILDLFWDISQKAKYKAEQELTEIREYFWLETLQAWDLAYYARKLKKEKYALDDTELKKYFEFESVLQGMFETVQRLYWLDIQPIQIPNDASSTPSQEDYFSDIQTYQVFDRDGKFLSYFFTDYFYRPLKRHGAWANILRAKFKNKKKIVLNVANFQKWADGKTLLTLSDVETMFHEFGHATHEMMSSSPHSELSGFHVEWDFVELPSQLLENWARHPDGLALFAKHVESGEDIPQEMVQTLQELEKFWTGTMIVKQNEYAMMDMMFHTQEDIESPEKLTEIIKQTYASSSVFPQPNIYSPHTSFSHIFNGGYAAGYYSYMWAELLEKEVWRAFVDSGNVFSPEVAQKLYDTILSAGTIKKAPELFRDFMGRDVQIDAFLQEKWLADVA